MEEDTLGLEVCIRERRVLDPNCGPQAHYDGPPAWPRGVCGWKNLTFLSVDEIYGAALNSRSPRNRFPGCSHLGRGRRGRLFACYQLRMAL